MPKETPSSTDASQLPSSDSSKALVDRINAYHYSLLTKAVAGVGADAADARKGVVCSSFSVCHAVGLVLAGLDDQEGAFSSDRTITNSSYNRDLIPILRSVAHPSPSTTIAVASSVWIRSTISIPQSFSTKITSMAGSVNAVPNLSAEAINSWISETTKGQIGPMVGKDVEREDCALVSAVYFKSSWKTKFRVRTNDPLEFHTMDGTTKPLERMTCTTKYLVGDDGAGGTAVSVPFADGQCVARFIMAAEPPSVDGNKDPLTYVDIMRLCAENTRSVPNMLNVALVLPRKINLTSSVNLLKVWKDSDVEGSTTDTSGISFASLTKPMRFLGETYRISQAVHAARLSMDENGAEAAAATVIVNTRSMVRPASVVFDRPFLVEIVHSESNVITFLGLFTGGTD
ncbi:hypothetical protein M427DRAFT_55185 [Gonapodya prolifera JEL478]|uniref:Serpin domain-containing protein n=1 Tax=Gonapodya prolifera (strain JEL478) TaxID=1344416 RepID=A0A139AJ88_GONPJ|nr:hypothetical protein M427DRAFT_55185 [Gonapodya prolifera JEL478]|eukprot:KXS16852.1 hypothetical protein M427DRAFT_55185 [Gonapodya prolifera JEL478]